MHRWATGTLCWLLCNAWLLNAGCGGATPPPDSPRSFAPTERQPAAPSGPRPTGGSSDGVSCEEARDQNVEEVAIGQASGPDLTARELSAPLSQGSYLNACEVPGSTKVSVCAAVRNGLVVGVTVAMDPPSPELELCVAKQVRAISFPSNPKLDIVKTEF